MRGQPEHDTRPIATQFPEYGCIDDLAAERSLADH